jgi:hypothetical protein
MRVANREIVVSENVRADASQKVFPAASSSHQTQISLDRKNEAIEGAFTSR